MKRRAVLCSAWSVLIACGCASIMSGYLPRMTVESVGQWFVADAEINGTSVKLIVDTGAGSSVLFRSTAILLGLKVTEPPWEEPLAPGEIPVGIAEECTVRIWGSTSRATFGVLDLPRGVLTTEEDGIIGWPAIAHTIIELDGSTFAFLYRIPSKVSTWPRFALRPGADTLGIEIPNPTGPEERIEIDTGDSSGLSLNSREWREWTATHPDRPRTLGLSYSPARGWRLRELTWAKSKAFGPIALTQVPILENLAEPRRGVRAVLGLAALRRLDLIVDGRQGFAYVRPTHRPAAPYPHNRLGAEFVPADVGWSDDLVAHVLDGSPAHEAGIRSGDVLLRIDDEDARKWGPEWIVEASRSWKLPPGTKLELALRRDGREFQTTVLLRDLIGPTVTSASPTDQ